MKKIRVCAAQINTTVGNLAGNRDKIIQALSVARQAGADLVTFPELAVTGYPPEDLLLRRDFINANLNFLRQLLPYTKGLTALVGFVDKEPAGLFNSAAILTDGRWEGTYHKTELPNYGVFDEKRYFLPGKKACVIRVGGLAIGLSICEDIWQQESLVYHTAKAGRFQLLVNISASPYQMGKEKMRKLLLKNLAVKSKAFVLYHNLVGAQDELVFDGGSLLVGPQGTILSQAKRFSEDCLISDIPTTDKTPRMKWACEEAEVYEALILGTRDYVQKNGFKKVLIGLSGGIDSALVASVAVDAIGPDRVLGVSMPSPYTSDATLRDARLLAKNLGMALTELKISDLFSCYNRTLKKIFKNLASDITEENLQARIRGNLLMAISNKFGYLVLTTGNKSEMATGYCTLYGDMAGGFAVIKDVPKTLVFKLSRHRNSKSRGPWIPPSIIRRPPTAELKPNQKDQDTLPPYPVLDKILLDYVEKNQLPKGFLAKGIVAMVDRNEYKRRQSPPGIKITPRAFGRDRRMPITNNFR